MHFAYQRLFLIETVVAVLLVARYGFLAATESYGPRKGKAYLIASLAVSLWLCFSSLLISLSDASLPMFEFEGTITSFHVRDSDSRRYKADVQIHTTQGGDISIHTSDFSPSMKHGQHIKVRYRGETGELIQAKFYESNGKQEDVLNTTSSFSRIFVILLGLFLVWASFRKFRRDPKCTEESASADPSLMGTSDEKSILGLDDSPTRDEIVALKEDARAQFESWRTRSACSLAALLVCGGAVVLFSKQGPYHSYWESFGGVFLFLALTFLLVFVYCALFWWTAWGFLRDLRKIYP